MRETFVLKEAVRKEIKKDGHFRVPVKKSEPIEYNEEVVSLQARLLGDMQLARGLKAKLAVAMEILKSQDDLENVTEALVHVLKMSKTEAHERGCETLEKVGMLDRKDYYPAHISGGQQQRAAIARALAMEPDVMLFDEPTSALDPELVGEVLKVMRTLADEGRTMIVVTHEIGFARDVSNKVIFLHEGTIETQGPPAEMFDNPVSPRFRQFLANALH